MTDMSNQQIGSAGEKYAADYLISCGYLILAKNYASKYGEIDIIARRAGTIAFVEVKTRKTSCFGTAAQAVDRRKQQRIIRTAQLYTLLNEDSSSDYRFDIIEIYHNSFGVRKLNHIKGAFEI